MELSEKYCYSCGENDSKLVEGCIKSGCEHERVGEAFTEVYFDKILLEEESCSTHTSPLSPLSPAFRYTSVNAVHLFVAQRGEGGWGY